MGRPKAVRNEKPAKSASSDKKSRGKRYSDAEKAKILDQALTEIKNGGQITKIADKLGVTFFTLKNWLRESGGTKDSGGAIAQKRGRGRPKGSVKKVVVSTTGAAPLAISSVAVAKVPGKRGRKPGSTKVASKTNSDQLQNLENKLEELTRRYINLAHLYGEISSKVGSNKL